MFGKVMYLTFRELRQSHADSLAGGITDISHPVTTAKNTSTEKC